MSAHAPPAHRVDRKTDALVIEHDIELTTIRVTSVRPRFPLFESPCVPHHP
jgi:hypothetical protein